MIQNLRLPAVLAATGRSRSSLYADVKAGLFVAPIKIGRRASAWPSDEVAAIIRARIAGATEDEIRELVAQLVAARRA